MGFFPPKIGCAFVYILSPFSDHISFLFSSPDRARALFCIRGMPKARPLLNCAPSNEISSGLLWIHEYSSRGRTVEKTEFISSVAGTAENQVQN